MRRPRPPRSGFGLGNRLSVIGTPKLLNSGTLGPEVHIS